MSGRLPLHVTQNNKNNDITNPGGADSRMKLLPQRLKEVGNYATSLIGKWHVGARSTANLPINRGFDSHFGFLKGGEDHLTQGSNDGDDRENCVDLWRDHGPAKGKNGTHSTILYAAEAEKVIRQHAAINAALPDPAARAPLFMFLSWQAAHEPLEVLPSLLKQA